MRRMVAVGILLLGAGVTAGSGQNARVAAEPPGAATAVTLTEAPLTEAPAKVDLAAINETPKPAAWQHYAWQPWTRPSQRYWSWEGYSRQRPHDGYSTDRAFTDRSYTGGPYVGAPRARRSFTYRPQAGRADGGRRYAERSYPGWRTPEPWRRRESGWNRRWHDGSRFGERFGGQEYRRLDGYPDRRWVRAPEPADRPYR